MRRFRPQLTYANIMATIAVFAALGGSSYAAITVTGKHVRNNSLTGKDVKNNSLGSGDVKNRSLQRKDFKRGVLPGGPGAGGSAVAYAYINDNATLDADKSRNIAAVSRANALPNYYCITTSVPVENVIAGQANATGGEIDAMLSDPFTSCPAGTTATVRTYTSAGGNTPRDFFVAFN